MPVAGHRARADDAHLVALVPVEVERRSGARSPGPAQDGLSIAPDEVRHPAVVVDDVQVGAIPGRGEHSRPSAVAPPPAVQEDEARSVGVEQQVVEVMLGRADVAVRIRQGGHFGNRDDELRLRAGRSQVERVDAGVLGRQHLAIRVGDAGVAVAGPHVVQPAEVGADGGAAVGGDRVDRRRQRARFARLQVQDAGDEPVSFPVVPDDPAVRAGYPLQHAALLPAPRPCAANLSPCVACLQVDDAHRDAVVRPRLAALEVHPHAQHVAAGRVELQLVVVAEPVPART